MQVRGKPLQKRKGYEQAELPCNHAGDLTQGLIYKEAPHLGVIQVPWEEGIWHDKEPTPASIWYQLLHIPSASVVAVVRTRDLAFSLCEAAASVQGLGCPAPAADSLDRLLGVVRSFAAPIKPRPKPKPEVAPVQLQAIYRPGRTPSRAVRAADRTLAGLLGRAMAGDDTLQPEEYAKAREKAAEIAWRENLMAKVQHTLLDTDLAGLKPQKQPAPGFLVNGERCTWEGFKRTLPRLMALGDEIAQVAEEMCDLYESTEEWDTPADMKWAGLDLKFRDMVIEGVGLWQEAVAHLLCSPPEKQAQVELRLGHIGSRQRGWAELGRKTFLRHEYVLIPCRKYRHLKGSV